jgi:plasmid stability protein
MAQESVSRALDKVIVRLPDGMRDRLKVAAAENKRSMNAEIVARLDESFDPEVHEILFEAGKRKGAAIGAKLASGAAEPDQDVIYVALDANGLPISWDEIHEHIAAIRRAGAFNIHSMNVGVIDAKMESSADRQDEAKKLMLFYQRERRKLNAFPPKP